MQALEQLKAHFPAYVWKHVLSMVLRLMLLGTAKTLTALQGQQSVPTLSRTLNLYPWPLEELLATRRRLILQAWQKRHRWRPRSVVYPIKVVHRGRGKGRRTVIATDTHLSRSQLLQHLKHRWGIAAAGESGAWSAGWR